jgi:hypothetical protein
LSLLSHLLSQAVRVNGPFSRIINYGLNRVRFLSRRARRRTHPRSLH